MHLVWASGWGASGLGCGLGYIWSGPRVGVHLIWAVCWNVSDLTKPTRFSLPFEISVAEGFVINLMEPKPLSDLFLQIWCICHFCCHAALSHVRTLLWIFIFSFKTHKLLNTIIPLWKTMKLFLSLPETIYLTWEIKFLYDINRGLNVTRKKKII